MSFNIASVKLFFGSDSRLILTYLFVVDILTAAQAVFQAQNVSLHLFLSISSAFLCCICVVSLLGET